MSFAICRACSSVSNGMIEAIGPKISSLAIRAELSTSKNMVGSTKNPWLNGFPSGTPPPRASDASRFPIS